MRERKRNLIPGQTILIIGPRDDVVASVEPSLDCQSLTVRTEDGYRDLAGTLNPGLLQAAMERMMGGRGG